MTTQYTGYNELHSSYRTAMEDYELGATVNNGCNDNCHSNSTINSKNTPSTTNTSGTLSLQIFEYEQNILNDAPNNNSDSWSGDRELSQLPIRSDNHSVSDHDPPEHLQVNGPPHPQSTEGQAKSYNTGIGQTMRCLLANVRSMVLNKYHCKDLIETHYPDIAFFTETWLHDDDEAPTIFESIPEGYTIRTYNRTTRAGGIAVIHRKEINVDLHHSESINEFEHMLVKCTIGAQTTLLFLLVYRPPNLPRPPFPDSLANLIATIQNRHNNLITLGDFNFWLEEKKDRNTIKLLESMKSLELTQVVRGKTHKRGHTLDGIFSKRGLVKAVRNLPTSWTDHHTILFEVNTKTKLPPKTPNKRVITFRRWANMTEDPSLDDWFTNNVPPKKTLEDIRVGTSELLKCIAKAADHFAPLLQKTVQKNSKAWYTPELHKIKQELRRTERTWRHHQQDALLYELKRKQRAYNYKIKTNKKVHYTGRILKASNDSKELFRIVKEFTNPEQNQSQEQPDQELCNKLSEHFESKIEKFHQIIEGRREELELKSSNTAEQPTANTAPLSPPYPSEELHSFSALSKDQFLELVKNSRKSGSPLDPCPGHVFKAILINSPALREAARILINHSILSGQIPPSRKESVAKPIIKKKNANPKDPNNFRPVTNNGFLAKLEDKAIFSQLYNYIEGKKILNDFQLGFRKKMSTESATTNIWDDIKKQYDRNEATALILLDLSAAFDTVDHQIMKERLENCGVHDSALNWILSFLMDRTQTTWLHPYFSPPKKIKYGVPQGASLSPLLFNIYLSPLIELIQSFGLTCYNFADDTQIVYNIKNPLHNINPNIELCLESVANWMTRNHLVINPSKTEIMLCGNHKLFPSPFPWPDSMGLRPSLAEDCINLGIIMDRKILLQKHCSKVTKNCLAHIRRLRKIMPYLAFPQKVTLMLALVMSRLDFANSILLGTSNSNLNILQRVQNIAARLVLNLNPRDHISRALHYLHWLPVGRRITFKSMCIIHRAIQGTGPPIWNDKFKIAVPYRITRQGVGPLLQEPRFKKFRAGGKMFSRMGAKIWNALPEDIRTIENHLAFRKKLKTWLFPTKNEALSGTRKDRTANLPNTEERRQRRRRTQ